MGLAKAIDEMEIRITSAATGSLTLGLADEAIRGASQIHRFLAIEYDGQFQGLMAVLVEPLFTRIAPIRQPLLYVDYLETAPWNQTRLPGYRRYGLIGLQLIYEAVRMSQREGWNGRIGLHSLANATGFYEKVGLRNLGPDRKKENLAYFEYDRIMEPFI